VVLRGNVRQAGNAVRRRRATGFVLGAAALLSLAGLSCSKDNILRPGPSAPEWRIRTGAWMAGGGGLWIVAETKEPGSAALGRVDSGPGGPARRWMALGSGKGSLWAFAAARRAGIIVYERLTPGSVTDRIVAERVVGRPGRWESGPGQYVGLRMSHGEREVLACGEEQRPLLQGEPARVIIMRLPDLTVEREVVLPGMETLWAEWESDDSGLVVLARPSGGAGRGSWYRVSAKGSVVSPLPLPDDAQMASVAPLQDGSLVFLRLPCPSTGGLPLWQLRRDRMSPIGSGAVLSGLDIAAGCVVNPDGGSAAFFSNAKGSPGIWIVDLADGSCRRVLSSARAAPLCWDPTGSRLAVVEEGVSIAVVEVGGGAAQVVYQLPARG